VQRQKFAGSRRDDFEAARRQTRQRRRRPRPPSIGELLVDFTPVVEDGETVGFRMHSGGSPYNVAIGLARCGARVEFAGKASTDFFGRFLVGTLEREGVGTRFVSRSLAPSTLAFVALEHGDPSFSFYGAGTADTQLHLQDLPDAIDYSGVLHFGSISLLTGPTSETVLALVDRLRGRCLLSFDPNIRVSLIRDPDAYRQILTRAFRQADVVKLSAEDLAWLMPGRPADDAAAEIRALGPALVVMTAGPRGCRAWSAALEIRLSAPSVAVVDTVGAGDAFTSGLLWHLGAQGLASRKALEEAKAETLKAALRFATAAATLTCTRVGADPPTRDQVERFLEPR
jgi:fructokinase